MRETPYTRHLTDRTRVWKWAAFDYRDFSIIAPVGTLGQPREFIADEAAAEIWAARINGRD
jgi:hypothetical protein